MPIDDAVVQRLRSARGHLDAVTRMAEADRSCMDVLHQLSAVQGALEGVRRRLLERHLRECLEAAVSASEMENLVSDLLMATFGSLTPGVHTR